MNQKKYLSFLLRLWRVRQNDNDIWRASLEDSRTGERRGFAGLEALTEFLSQLTQGGGEERPKNKTPGGE